MCVCVCEREREVCLTCFVVNSPPVKYSQLLPRPTVTKDNMGLDAVELIYWPFILHCVCVCLCLCVSVSVCVCVCRCT